jgi:hypothetical protein
VLTFLQADVKIYELVPSDLRRSGHLSFRSARIAGIQLQTMPVFTSTAVHIVALTLSPNSWSVSVEFEATQHWPRD